MFITSNRDFLEDVCPECGHVFICDEDGLIDCKNSLCWRSDKYKEVKTSYDLHKREPLYRREHNEES